MHGTPLDADEFIHLLENRSVDITIMPFDKIESLFDNEDEYGCNNIIRSFSYISEISDSERSIQLRHQTIQACDDNIKRVSEYFNDADIEVCITEPDLLLASLFPNLLFHVDDDLLNDGTCRFRIRISEDIHNNIDIDSIEGVHIETTMTDVSRLKFIDADTVYYVNFMIEIDKCDWQETAKVIATILDRSRRLKTYRSCGNMHVSYSWTYTSVSPNHEYFSHRSELTEAIRFLSMLGKEYDKLQEK